jgi:hypothetical protein
MSNAAVNMNGGLVQLYDQVTVHGSCTSISGTSPSVKETVTFTTPLGDVVTVQSGDLRTRDHQPIPPYYGRTTDAGKAYQAVDEAVIDGVVTGIVNGPWGITGQLTVLTDFSGTSIVVSSGSVDSHG